MTGHISLRLEAYRKYWEHLIPKRALPVEGHIPSLGCRWVYPTDQISAAILLTPQVLFLVGKVAQSNWTLNMWEPRITCNFMFACNMSDVGWRSQVPPVYSMMCELASAKGSHERDMQALCVSCYSKPLKAEGTYVWVCLQVFSVRPKAILVLGE